MAYIMQGDAYGIRVKLRTKAGVAVTPENTEDVEIVIGNKRKTYKSGVVTWDTDAWVFPMSQEESFAFFNNVRCQARVKFLGGDVIGVFIQVIDVVKSDSKVVL